MSWKKIGGIDYSQYSNNIHSNLSNFNTIETLKINSNNTSLHVASNTLRLGNNTGSTSQVNAIWFGGLDPDTNESVDVDEIPRSSMEEKYFRSEYIGDVTKKELFIYKGDTIYDRIRLKSSNIVFDTYEESNFNNSYSNDRYAENIRMLINNTGSVGINTLNPRTKLDINGQLLSGYGSGINGNNTVYDVTGERYPLISNGYYYCGTLDVAYDFSQTLSGNNNGKLKIEIFGGDMTSTSGMGIDTYVIANNINIVDLTDTCATVNETSTSTSTNQSDIHAIIYKSSMCGGTGYDANSQQTNDLYKLCIYRNKNTGKDDVYIYIRGYIGTTVNIRSFMISNTNNSMNYMDEQHIKLKYQSSDNSNRPDKVVDDEGNLLFDAVYGPQATNIKYRIKYGVIERYDGKFGFGTDTFNSDTDYGSVTCANDISLNGNTQIFGNARIEENVYMGKNLTINGKIYLNGEMNVNSVVMQNYQILQHASVGGGITLNTTQLVTVNDGTPTYTPNLNTIMFDNQNGLYPTTSFKISQIDEYIENDNKQYNFLSITRADNADYYDYADIAILGDSGKIGMGLTTPQNKLDINGNLCIGNTFSGNYTSPENGALIEGSVGIGTSIISNSGDTELRVGGNIIIGNTYSKLNNGPLETNNGMIIQSAVGIGIREPKSILDVGGAITFADGSKQSFASSFLGAKTNGLLSPMGTKDPNVFTLNNTDYPIKNTVSSRYVVDCNNTGSMIAIGCSNSEVNGIAGVGNVTIYMWSGMVWTQMGYSLIGNVENKMSDGTITGENFGSSLAISGSGETLIIGSPNTCYNNNDFCGKIIVYSWYNNFWSPRCTYYGDEVNSYIGLTCCISKLGSYVCFGGNNINYIYNADLDNCIVYNTTTSSSSTNNTSVTGTLTPQKIMNKSEDNTTNKFGCSISINREGTIMIVGSCNADVLGVNSGCIYIYIQRLSDGELIFDDNYYIKVDSPQPLSDQGFGSKVSMNSLGTRFAISAPNYSNQSYNVGAVFVYNLLSSTNSSLIYEDSDNSNLVTITGSLYGLETNEQYGSCININGSGEYLVISSSGTTSVYGKINMYHYDSTSSWLQFSETFISNEYTLPGTTLGVSSDSTIIVVGYDLKYENQDYNCGNVLRLGTYENTLTTESSYIKHGLSLGKTTSEHPIDIYENTDKNIITITADVPVDSINNEGTITQLLDQYEGGILLQNSLQGNTTLFLKNTDTILENISGSININYNKGFSLCELDEDYCTMHAKGGKVAINHNNPISPFDVRGTQRLNDTNNNVLISSAAFLKKTSGTNNTTIGQQGLYNIVSGNYNVGIGFRSGYLITAGIDNIAIGSNALYTDCLNYNVAIGANALTSNAQHDNVAVGYNSLKDDIQGSYNTALGSQTNVDGTSDWQYSTAIGYKAIIGKSNSIILGDSTNTELCVGIGNNSPTSKLDITGDLTVSDSVTINDILYPNKGLNIDNDFIVDIETKITTINNDLTVNSDTVLNTLVVNDFCKPNLGININEGDCTIGVGGYSVFGQTGDTFSTNKNNPLITVNGFVRMNQDIDIIGTISASSVETNYLTFTGLFSPNGGIGMFPSNSKTEPVFSVAENSGSTYINGTLSVDGSCAFNNGISSYGDIASVFHNDVSIDGSITCSNSETIFTPNSVTLSDGRTSILLNDFTDIGPGIKIEAQKSQIVIKAGVENVTIEGNLSVEGELDATNIQGGGVVPIGGIIMWSGSETTIPSGWALCNGQNTTPDLRGRFIIGSTQGQSVSLPTSTDGGNSRNQEIDDTVIINQNTTGGYSSISIVTDNLPAHKHDVDKNSQSHVHNLNTQPHTHEIEGSAFSSDGFLNAWGTVSGPKGNDGLNSDNPVALANGNYSVASPNLFQIQSVQTVADNDNAAYALTIPEYNNNGRSVELIDYVSLQVEPSPIVSETINTSIESPELSSFTTNTWPTADDSGITTSNTGENQRIYNMPQYYSLAYIMRIF